MGQSAPEPDDVEEPDPVELVETDESPDHPPAEWDAGAHAEEYEVDPFVVVTEEDDDAVD